jgi:hypothetical protein
MPDKHNKRDEQTPNDAALAFVATLLAGILILALLGLSWWSPADQLIAVAATFAVSGIVSAQLRSS